MNLPNIITIVRFLAVPLVIYALLHDQAMAAFIIFTTAGISDGVDGVIARRFDQQTELGAWLDPLADKALMISVFVTLAWLGKVQDWLVFLAVTRDVMIVGAVAVSNLMGDGLEVKPILISKFNTAVQIILVVWVLAGDAFGFHSQAITWMLTIASALLTIGSGADYLRVWTKHITGGDL